VRITLEDGRDFARGAAFLGTGGGGDPYIGRLLLEQALKRNGPTQVLTVEELADDALVIPLAGMGAPTVIVEKTIGFNEGEKALRTLEARLGRRATAIMSAEMGGMNALFPAAMAAHLGLPLVDADGMGRAFPELQMVSFNILGQRAAPMVMCDEYGDTVLIESSDNHRVEKLARPVIVPMGGLCMLAIYPMSGRAVKDTAVRGTLSLALRIGRTISTARREQQDPFEALFACLRSIEHYQHSRTLFDGKIVDLRRETQRGWAIGHVVLEDIAGRDQMSVTFRNEFLRAQRHGRTVAIVPDLITILDRETAEPVTTENLKYGQRVRVVGCSVPPLMRSERALAVWGPGAFGFDEPFVPIEAIPESSPAYSREQS
jgi:DUF917 family protein